MVPTQKAKSDLARSGQPTTALALAPTNNKPIAAMVAKDITSQPWWRKLDDESKLVTKEAASHLAIERMVIGQANGRVAAQLDAINRQLAKKGQKGQFANFLRFVNIKRSKAFRWIKAFRSLTLPPQAIQVALARNIDIIDADFREITKRHPWQKVAPDAEKSPEAAGNLLKSYEAHVKEYRKHKRKLTADERRATALGERSEWDITPEARQALVWRQADKEALKLPRDCDKQTWFKVLCATLLFRAGYTEPIQIVPIAPPHDWAPRMGRPLKPKPTPEQVQ